MSAITSEWPLVIAQEAAVRPSTDDGGYSRAEEFRIALDRYMAGYIDQQHRRAAMMGRGRCACPARVASQQISICQDEPNIATAPQLELCRWLDGPVPRSWTDAIDALFATPWSSGIGTPP
jgi:hypothetical protein